MMNTFEKKIIQINNTRSNHLKIWYDSWNDEKNGYDLDEPKEIDILGNQILQLIKKHQDKLSVDFIIESLTKLGFAPSILYDDNAHFAISSEGFQSISSKPSDTEMTLYVKKKYWKTTIRKAIKIYLSEFK